MIEDFSFERITVIGDLFLDCYVAGSVSRFSPEAPAPVLLRAAHGAVPGPNVIVKGADYQEHKVVGGDFVKSYGGAVVLADLVSGRSTSALVGKMRRPSPVEPASIPGPAGGTAP